MNTTYLTLPLILLLDDYILHLLICKQYNLHFIHNLNYFYAGNSPFASDLVSEFCNPKYWLYQSGSFVGWLLILANGRHQHEKRWQKEAKNHGIFPSCLPACVLCLWGAMSLHEHSSYSKPLPWGFRNLSLLVLSFPTILSYTHSFNHASLRSGSINGSLFKLNLYLPGPWIIPFQKKPTVYKGEEA